jgi:CRP/FNR family transcriptional regulator
MLVARLVDIGLPLDAGEAVARVGRLVRFEQGAALFRPGEPCAGYVLPLSGEIAVTLIAASGREVPLYDVGPGELCIQTFQCLVTGATYAAEGRARTDLEALLLTPLHFDALLGDVVGFRRFVLDRVAQRLAGLASLVEMVAEAPASMRLARKLLQRGDTVIETTHAALARDIVSAREVVTRTLGQWERDGLVVLARGRITVRDRDGLSQIADGRNVT